MLPQNTELPDPPYFAVIFTSIKKYSAHGYDEMAEKMIELSAQQKGFLGVQSVRSNDGFGITVSYWKTLDDISNWKNHADHQIAQTRGKQDWYADYEIRICKVERQYRLGNKDRLDTQ